jgi:hypothetical protein
MQALSADELHRKPQQVADDARPLIEQVLPIVNE